MTKLFLKKNEGSIENEALKKKFLFLDLYPVPNPKNTFWKGYLSFLGLRKISNFLELQLAPGTPFKKYIYIFKKAKIVSVTKIAGSFGSL